MRLWVDIDTRDNTDALDHPLFATTSLPANRLNRFGIRFRKHRIVKKQGPVFIKLNIGLYRFPAFASRNTSLA